MLTHDVFSSNRTSHPGSMGLLTQLRTMVLLSVVISSVIVIGINANYLAFSTFHHADDGDDSDSDSDDDDDDDDDARRHLSRKLSFASTGVAIAALTLVTIVPLSILHIFRPKSKSSVILFEIGWVSILVILWAVLAGQVTTSSVFGSCSSVNDRVMSLCQQYRALQTFAWLTFTILLLWLAVVFVVAAMAHTRGHTRVWLYSFREAVHLSRSRDHQEDIFDGKTPPDHLRAWDGHPPSYASPVPYVEGYQPVYAGQADYVQNPPVVYQYPLAEAYVHPGYGQFQTGQQDASHHAQAIPQV